MKRAIFQLLAMLFTAAGVFALFYNFCSIGHSYYCALLPWLSKMLKCFQLHRVILFLTCIFLPRR